MTVIKFFNYGKFLILKWQVSLGNTRLNACALIQTEGLLEKFHKQNKNSQ